MKKYILIFVAVLTAFSTSAQKKTAEPEPDPRDNRVFATAEDFKNNNPVAGVVVRGWGAYHPKLEKNNEPVKVKELGSENFWFMNFGTLMRRFDGDYYVVYYFGKVSYFGRWNDNMQREYYSEGPEGEMKKLSDDTFDDLLEKYNLKKKFDSDNSDKAEFKDNVYGLKDKKVRKKAKYFALISEQIK